MAVRPRRGPAGSGAASMRSGGAALRHSMSNVTDCVVSFELQDVLMDLLENLCALRISSARELCNAFPGSLARHRSKPLPTGSRIDGYRLFVRDIHDADLQRLSQIRHNSASAKFSLMSEGQKCFPFSVHRTVTLKHPRRQDADAGYAVAYLCRLRFTYR